jgi:hypothetical protein
MVAATRFDLIARSHDLHGDHARKKDRDPI